MGAPLTAKGKNGTRILRAFSLMAQAHGVRNVVMADLARGLGISTATLYRAFPTKVSLVDALLDDMADEFRRATQSAQLLAARDPRNAMKDLVIAWAAIIRRLSPVHWEQVEADFPEAYGRFEKAISDGQDFGREVITPYIRDGINREVAEFVLTSALNNSVRSRAPGAPAVEEIVRFWTEAVLRPTARDVVANPAAANAKANRRKGATKRK